MCVSQCNPLYVQEKFGDLLQTVKEILTLHKPNVNLAIFCNVCTTSNNLILLLKQLELGRVLVRPYFQETFPGLIDSNVEERIYEVPFADQSLNTQILKFTQICNIHRLQQKK